MTLAASPTLARIPAGDFLMGAADASEDERPVHRVYVSEFFIGRFPVTQDEYARFVRATGYRRRRSASCRSSPAAAMTLFRELAAPYVWRDGAPPAGHGSHPVVLVRYEDAVAYCSMAVRGARPRCPAADRSRMGKGRARRRRGFSGTRGATRSIRRACNFLVRPGDEAPARHAADRNVSAERATGCTTWPATCGSGSPTGTAATTTRSSDAAIRAVPQRVRCGSSAADHGSTRTSRCCGARIVTRCRRTRTRTA